MAVVGVDNDELLCELADPPLSSVALNANAGGYRAAALLDRMMRGRLRKPVRLTVEPLHVVTRRSTDMVALEDSVVASALHFIHDHAGQPIDVADVVEHVLVSRRALEIRFKKVTGRTLLGELRRVRLERARRLLQETDLSLSRVASAAGFSSEVYLTQVFRQELGETPARYRRQVRAEAGA
jgi:LacI family transcriptional regulator